MFLFIVWLTFIIVLSLNFVTCVSQNQNGNNNDVLDKQIFAIRKLLSDNQGKDGYKLINADLWRKLGIILQSKDIRHHQGGGKLQPEALEAFNNALRLDEGRTQSLNIQVNYLKGILLKMMGSGDESLQSLDLALEHKLTNSDWSSVSYHKGEAFLMLGQIPAAAQWYRKSIKLAPCKTDRYYSFVQACRELKTMTREKWIALMNEIRHVMSACLSDEELNVSFEEFDSLDRSTAAPVSEGGSQVITGSGENEEEEDEEEEDYSLQSYLQFNDESDDSSAASIENSAVYWALYITAEKAERFSLAWWYLDKANALEKSRREIKYQREDTLGQRSQITGVFQRGFWDSLPDMSGDSSRTPIFIIGMMRSGSTLLETMFDSHGQIWGMGEDSLFNGNLTFFRDQLVRASTSSGSQSERMQEVEVVLKQYGTDTSRKMRRLAVSRVGDKDKAKRVKHVVDKMLFNYRNIGFIHLVFPDALIIHTVRDPMDTLFSCYRNKFDDFGLEWSLDVGDLVLQYAVYLEIMAHFRKVLPGRVVDLRYEDLITNPEKVMRDLIVTRLGLKWDPNVLNFHANNRTVHTHSQSQVRQNIYKHSVGSWRRYAQQLQPMIDELNKHLPKLRKNKALPFLESMNWDLDLKFNYDAFLGQPPPSVVHQQKQQVLSESLKKNKKVKKDKKASKPPTTGMLTGEQEL